MVEEALKTDKDRKFEVEYKKLKSFHAGQLDGTPESKSRIETDLLLRSCEYKKRAYFLIWKSEHFSKMCFSMFLTRI